MHNVTKEPLKYLQNIIGWIVIGRAFQSQGAKISNEKPDFTAVQALAFGKQVQIVEFLE